MPPLAPLFCCFGCPDGIPFSLPLFGASGRLCCAVGGLCVLFGLVRLRRSPVRSPSVVSSLLALALLSVCSVALAPPGLCPCPPLSRGQVPRFSSALGAPRPSQVPRRGVPCAVECAEVPQKIESVLFAMLVCGIAVTVRRSSLLKVSAEKYSI